MLDSETAKGLIKPHMPVVCSDNGQFAVVDHVEGLDFIKLTKDASGQHHYIPLTWVTSVDDKAKRGEIWSLRTRGQPVLFPPQLAFRAKRHEARAAVVQKAGNGDP